MSGAGASLLDEASVVAVNAKDGRPIAVGAEAYRMLGGPRRIFT